MAIHQAAQPIGDLLITEVGPDLPLGNIHQRIRNAAAIEWVGHHVPGDHGWVAAKVILEYVVSVDAVLIVPWPAIVEGRHGIDGELIDGTGEAAEGDLVE